MAFERLTLSGYIWRPAGLSHVLAPPGGWPEAAAVSVEPESAAAAREPVAPLPRQAASPISQDIESREATGKKDNARAPAWKPVPVEEWPPVWREQFGLTRSAMLAWSYWNLGPDLLALRGAARESEEERDRRLARMQFLKKLFRDIGLPKTTHTFWPPHLQSGEAPEPLPDIFWSGLNALDCRGVLLFGSPAAKAVLPGVALRPLTNMRKNGIIAWILWDIETFGRKPENYKSMLTFLRQALKPFYPLQ